jgi:DNA-binding CsgD family transcriptional regulator
MSEAPLRIAIDIADSALAARLRAALSAAPGIALVEAGAAAEAVLSEAAVPEADAPLTAREMEVLSLLAEGASNKEVARRLGISPHTAKFHVGQVLDKLDASGRADAMAQAARRRVIQL